MTTMQKVAWPTTTVKKPRPTPRNWVKVVFRATPVTMPGRAIGRMTRNEIVSRPKNRKRATAREASEPRISARTVATAATSSEVKKASRAPLLVIASPTQSVVSPGGGHSSALLVLKA